MIKIGVAGEMRSEREGGFDYTRPPTEAGEKVSIKVDQ